MLNRLSSKTSAICGLVIFLPLPVGKVLFFFFFSSRRRHTRLQGDWSSDVCSSDLERMGVGGRPFRCFKFRTMTWQPHGDGPAITMDGDRRITRFGKVLRRFRIDELDRKSVV